MLKPNDHVLEYVDDFLHEVLEPADAAYVERHCEDCRICKVALEEARKRHAVLETVPVCEASGQLIQATLTRIDAYERGRRRRRKVLTWSAFSAVAATVALLTVATLHYQRLTASPYDLEVFGQRDLFAGSDGSLRIRLVHEKTGAGQADVPVDIELRDPTADHSLQLVSFTTNAQGTGQPRFRLPDWSDGSYELRIVARPPGGTEVLTEQVRLKRSWKLMLTSDKPVYQPGQTIHVRSLTLRKPDLKPVAGQALTFTVADPKGNIIFKQSEPTSRFGIAAADCPLATEILEGAYTVACKVGDTDSKLTVDVRKYVLPKFKIDVQLDKPYYRPGDKVSAKVHAEYFFGKPVAAGGLEIEVRTSDVGTHVYRKLSARTGESGNAAFEFELPKSLVGVEQHSGDARFAVGVTLTDSAGQKQTRSVSSAVTLNPLRVEVMAEAGTLVRDVPNTIFVYASYADGRPAKARVAVTGVNKEIATNALGVASFELTPWEGQVNLTVRATDAEGLVGRRTVPLSYNLTAGDFLVRTDKAVYNGGETVHLVALGSGVQPVFVDFLKDDQTVLTAALDLANGRGDYHLDLPPELFGTVKLSAYRFGLAGVAVRKTRALFIRPAGQLDIRATMDQGQYRPGKTAKLQLALTDPKGQPVPGALSLAAVDEAVYAVLEQAPGMERTFYLLEQQLLQPVYAIYPWAPDLTTSTPPERSAFDQALFSRTSTTEIIYLSAPPPSSDTMAEPAAGVRPKIAGRQLAAPTVPTGRPMGFSLAVTSFPAKEQQVAETRERGLVWVKAAWFFVGGLLFLTLYLSLWLFARTSHVVVLHGLGLLGLCVWALPYGLELHPAGRSRVGQNGTVASAWRGGGAPMPPADMAMAKEAPLAEPAAALAPTMEQFQKQRPGSGVKAEAEAPPVRVREWFPETLLWRPEVITDDQGRASVDIPLADSITTWRLMASAVAADGRLGGTQTPIRVFQPFFVDLNLPVALTRGDEVALPVVVYNYLDKAQTVELTLADGGWFERQGEAVKRLDLKPGEVRSLSYRLRATRVGDHQLQVTARGSGVADALKKQIEVIPDGRRVEQVFNGNLQQPAEFTLAVPAQAIDGSVKTIVKLYPSTFSQLVEGLDGIFRMPYGCFEQTSSTTYPNVLALEYLRRTGQRVPEVEAKARQYIHLGYQRLLGFEVAGGGFDWFGRPPANRTLTAYGLMEFQDMAKVHDVDPNLIQRTRQWLLAQRERDGAWVPEAHRLHEDPTRGAWNGNLARYSTTAYLAWAVFSDPQARNDAQPTRNFLLSRSPEGMDDPYMLALAANALLAIDPKGGDAKPYLDRLDGLKRTSADGKLAWWEQSAEARTTFYGAGRSGSIETTALAALALIQAGQSPGTVRLALSWLTAQKDASGTWYSTQATVLALKALLAGTGQPLGGDRERHIEITWDQGGKKTVVIPPDQGEVMQQLDLSEAFARGSHRLMITERGDTATGYQVAFRYHVPGDKPAERVEPLGITMAYDRAELAVNDTVTATATVVNNMAKVAPMVLLDLPIPAGFALAAEDLDKLVKSGAIAKFQVHARSVIVYLRGLEPGKPLQLRYRLLATMPVKVTVPAAHAYEYYDRDKQGSSPTARLTVRDS